MTDSVKRMIEMVRQVRMSPAERETQRRSFAYGNTHFENERITRDMVNQQAEKLKAQPKK